MKIEDQPVVCHSNISAKFVPKSFDCDNDALEPGGIKLEDQKELTSPLKGNDQDAEQLLHNNIAADGWVAPKHDCLGLYDFNHYDEVKASVSPFTNSSKVDLFEEDSELYMEKSIVECQLPELIVCYKENICNIVKDICIDEGVPSRDMLLFGNSLDEKAMHAIAPSEKDWKDELQGELEKREMFSSGDLEHAEFFSNKDSPKQCDSKDLERIPEAEYDVAYFTDNDIPNLPMKDLVVESLKPLINHKNESHPQSEKVFIESASLEVPVSISAVENSSSTTEEVVVASATTATAPQEPKHSTSVNDISYDSKVDNGNITFDFNSLASIVGDGTECRVNGDSNSSAPTISASVDCQNTSSSNPSATTATAPQEPKHSTSVNDVSYDSKVDNGNITFDFNSLASIVGDGTECHVNGDSKSSAPTISASVDCQNTGSSNPSASTGKSDVQCHHTSSNPKCVGCEDLLKAEVGISGSHSVSSQGQHGIGETSFSSMGPLGSLMSNSGRIGSISLRSDSSTTSARSFAFPILQSEWNSSPVRMAKADRRKHRGWKHGLLCCRF